MTKPLKEPPVDSEAWAHKEVVIWLRQAYPALIFRTDFASGLHMPPWLAKKHASVQSGKGFPDLFIFQPSQGYHGLALELKAPGRRIKKINGDWADDDCRRQNKMLERLDDLGYAAYFASGLEEAKVIINWYLRKGDTFISVGRLPIITKPLQSEIKVGLANAENVEKEIF